MNGHYEYIFVVLVYRNIEDLRSFIDITRLRVKESYKIIVVNSYFDNETKCEFENISKHNNCEFLNVENKGYGYGNNKGIEYALQNYVFDYLVISNPDVEIQALRKDDLVNFENSIIAPQIIKLNGKNQNPYYSNDLKIIDKMKYVSYKNQARLLFLIAVIFNKVIRAFFLLHNRFNFKKVTKIFACHGSFIIVGKKALDTLNPMFNENMFLFAEENHLAQLAKHNSIEIFYNPKIKVLHKVDGSVSLEKSNMPLHASESFIKYYEYWSK